MKIAILGWGSLVWNPRKLPLSGDWQRDGPLLPIEFSRISADGRLTLVIDETNGAPVRTLYALSLRAELNQAITDLMEREGITNRSRIGYCDLHANTTNPDSLARHPDACETIRAWAAKRKFDAVIWTALGPRFKPVTQEAFSPAGALRYLDSLPATTRTKALAYIHSAPESTMTAFRRLVMQHHPDTATQSTSGRA
jgi:hypothetical protein